MGDVKRCSNNKQYPCKINWHATGKRGEFTEPIGKDVESFCYLFEKMSRNFDWTKDQRKLQLLINCNPKIRNMFLDAGDHVM